MASPKPDYATLPDAELAALCAARPVNEDAWTVLYSRYRSLVVQRIRTLSATVSDAEAEELAHDIFLRVFNSLSKFDAARGSLAGFISVITRSRVIEHWRRWHIQDKATKSIDEVALSAPRFAIQRGLDRELVGRISLAVASSMNTERKKHVAAELVRQQTVTEVVQKTGLSRDQVYAVRNELEPLLVAAFEAVQFSKNLQ